MAREHSTLPVGTIGGLAVGAQGFGCLPTTDFYGRPSESDAIAVIRAALDAGITLFDTADVQGAGVGERLLGRAVAGLRDAVVLATKFGMRRGADGVFRGLCGEPDYVRQACENSLRRLGVDHIDLYHQHWIDPAVPVEETAGAVAELVRAGKVRHWGLSEPSAATLRRAHAEFPVTTVESEWSLWSRGIEDEVLPVCRALGVGVLAYAPLSRGLLTAKITAVDDLAEGDFRRSQPRFAPANLARNAAAARRLAVVAADGGITAAQLALIWVHRRGGDVVPIPGTSRLVHLTENIVAARLALDPGGVEDSWLLAAEQAVSTAAGERYAPAMLAMTGR